MFKLNITHDSSYGEVSQPNPLRWRIMHRQKDTLHSQSNLIKCKDFFNDIVAWKRAKHKFTIYGFTNDVKFNRDGLYFHLTNIANLEQFCNNLVHVQERLQKDLGVLMQLHPQEDKTMVIVIPHKVWKNTFYISMLSMMIRCCNYNVSYTCWEDIFDEKAPINRAEHAFTPKAKAYAKQHGFLLPKEYRKFWYFCGDVHSNDGKKPMATVVHNNGVCSWLSYIKV